MPQVHLLQIAVRVANSGCIERMAYKYYLESVIGPRAELHDAGLLVERKVLDVDLTRGFVDSRRAPLHAPRVIQRRLCRQRHLKVPVSTVAEGQGESV